MLESSINSEREQLEINQNKYLTIELVFTGERICAWTVYFLQWHVTCVKSW